MNQNCCFPKQVRCQIIARFRLHIVTVFRAQISGGARWELGGVGVWVGIGTRRWKNSRTLSQRKNFNKAPASLVPVFKWKWSFQDLKKKLIPKTKVEKQIQLLRSISIRPGPYPPRKTNKQTNKQKMVRRENGWSLGRLQLPLLL